MGNVKQTKKKELDMADSTDVNKGIEARIIRYGKLLYKRGLVSGADGNLSSRKKDGGFVVTASGVHKGLMESQDLVTLDASGNKVQGRLKPSSEIPMHLAIYKGQKEAGAVIHAHAPWCTALSLKKNKLDLSALAEGRILFPKVPVVPYYEPGSKELADAAKEAAQKSKIFILKAHGVVAWGTDLKEAFCLIEALENNVRILALSSFF